MGEGVERAVPEVGAPRSDGGACNELACPLLTDHRPAMTVVTVLLSRMWMPAVCSTHVHDLTTDIARFASDELLNEQSTHPGRDR